MSRLDERRTALMELASRPDGVTAQQAASAFRLLSWQARDMLRLALKHGVVMAPALQLGRRIAQHYFVRQAAADAWAQRQLRAGLTDASPSPSTGNSRRAPVVLPGSIGQRTDGPAPAEGSGNGPRITQGPHWTHDPRFQCAPWEVPDGAGFFAAGIGRDLETGKAWGR